MRELLLLLLLSSLSFSQPFSFFRSKISLLEQAQGQAGAVDTMSAIYDIIRTFASSLGQDNIPYDEILRRVIRKGYRQDDLTKTIHEYEQLNVWMLSSDKSTIVFL
jgi:hypothetical protein